MRAVESDHLDYQSQWSQVAESSVSTVGIVTVIQVAVVVGIVAAAEVEDIVAVELCVVGGYDHAVRFDHLYYLKDKRPFRWDFRL